MRGRRDNAEVEEEEVAAASEKVLCIWERTNRFRKFQIVSRVVPLLFLHISIRRRKILLMAEEEGEEISGKEYVMKGLYLTSLRGLSV